MTVQKKTYFVNRKQIFNYILYNANIELVLICSFSEIVIYFLSFFLWLL